MRCISHCLPVYVSTKPVNSDDQFAHSYSNPYKQYISAEHSLTFHSKVTICITNSTDADDCITNPCVNGVCEDQVNGYLCVRDAGYNDTDCDNDIDNVLLILVPMVVHVLMMWIVLTVPVLMDTGEIHAVKVRGVNYR